MSEWKEVKLSCILNFISKGTTPPKGVGYVDKGINYVKSDAIDYNRKLDKSKIVQINEETHKKFKRSQLAENDILFSMAGIYLGKNAIVTKDILPANTNQALAILRLNQEKANPTYVSLYLSQQSIIDFVNNMSGQSAQPNVNFEEIKSIVIKLPPLPEQKSIATILSSLDDKIDLLHRQNATLEKMAETLFRQWFVEEAKEAWVNKPLSSIANFLNGLACQKFQPKNDLEKLPVLKIKELSSGISDNYDWATTDVKPEYIVKNGDVIFAWSASLMVKIWDGQDCILNQHLFKVTSNDYPKWFYYLWCKHHLGEFINKAASHATTMGHIKRGDLDEASVLVPPEAELKEMTLTLQPILDKLISNNNQIRTLAALRDTLLPKLMSGEVRVEM
jgi:type I restriction enzyme S subunit